MALDGGFLPQPVSRKTAGRVAIIGCGPAGMAAARELAGLDYDVTIFEAASQPGGTMTYGIPTFRLHKELLQREVQALTVMGVTIEYNVKIGVDKSLAELKEAFDAVFIAIGTMNAWNLGVDNDTIDGVVDAEQFLRDVQRVQNGEVALEDLPVQKGDQVIVVGAGNVAIDAARTSLRLGADVKIVYRRAEKNMKCLPSEYEEAKTDGVQFQFYSAPKAVVGTDHVEGLKYENSRSSKMPPWCRRANLASFRPIRSSPLSATNRNCPSSKPSVSTPMTMATSPSRTCLTA